MATSDHLSAARQTYEIQKLKLYAHAAEFSRYCTVAVFFISRCDGLCVQVARGDTNSKRAEIADQRHVKKKVIKTTCSTTRNVLGATISVRSSAQ
jgi:hypothetical protein